MREIKFRAWIPDIERMYSVKSIEVNPYNEDSCRELIVWEHPCERSAKIKGKIGRYRLSDEIPIMQYAGLKDKNGVEIYEGDIVKSTAYIGGNFLDNLSEIVHVEFFNSMWAIQPAKNRIIRPQHISNLDDNCEVIGNIYENPELLESEHE